MSVELQARPTPLTAKMITTIEMITIQGHPTTRVLPLSMIVTIPAKQLPTVLELVASRAVLLGVTILMTKELILTPTLLLWDQKTAIILEKLHSRVPKAIAAIFWAIGVLTGCFISCPLLRDAYIFRGLTLTHIRSFPTIPRITAALNVLKVSLKIRAFMQAIALTLILFGNGTPPALTPMQF